jgi:hypothetical protein
MELNIHGSTGAAWSYETEIIPISPVRCWTLDCVERAAEKRTRKIRRNIET